MDGKTLALLYKTVQDNNILPITTICNVRCAFCSHQQNPPEVQAIAIPHLSFDLIIDLLDYLDGGRKIIIGESTSLIMEGEPFTHPQFFETLEAIRHKFPQTPTITRAKYLDRIIELNGTPDIKIITGIRRSGKSKLMQAYIAYLKSNFENINIIFIDFMDLAYEEIKEYHALHAYVEEHYQEGKTNYLFVDEVQMCPKFELAINSLYSKGKYDIYVTGSNAFLLSADLATLFTGRYIEIHVFPFSFQEYCQYYDDISDKDKLFDEYAIKGGLAGSYAYRTEKDRTNYIKEVYETIVTRDLVQKYTLPDTLVLQRLSEFLMDNISNLTSPNKVSQLLTANETPTNHVTVGKYIKYLCNAFVFYDIKRYDIRGKKYLESSEKFYLCDSGIRYAILGSRNIDYGRVYENVVCIELLRRGYDVYVGKLYQKEIDFVAQRGSEKIYIQVSDNISGQETFERECSPLLQIRDAYPKMIIARTKHPQYSYEGIEIHDIADWLLQE